MMVTHWRGYWDKVESPYYTRGMIKFNKNYLKEILSSKERFQTIFVKLDKSSKEGGKPEKAWIGYTLNFRKEMGRKKELIYFDIENLEECTWLIIPRLLSQSQYERYRIEGWYICSDDEFEKIIGYMDFLPPFIQKLQKTCKWEEFEYYVFLLLKLIGIHEIIRYPPKEQSGRPDGFFKFKSLVVIYDCTLKRDIKSKKDQIENYCRKLLSNNIINGYDIKNCKKQVWIITKGKSRRIEDFEIEDVKVKEISIDDLINIYERRLLDDSMNTEKLEELLIKIGESKNL